MPILQWIVICILSSTTICAIDISPNNQRSLLPHTQIYIDYNHTVTMETIETKIFKSAEEDSLGFGYSPDLDVWVKIELYNPTDKPISKILEYVNPLTTHIELYDSSSQAPIAKEGLLQSHIGRESLTPYFELTLNPHEKHIYYLKSTSTITALVLELKLWEPRAFYNHSTYLRSILSLFFGAMFVIILYNLIIYFIVRERSYLYYVLFFTAVTLHQFSYRGVLALTLPPDIIRIFVEHATFVVAVPVFFLMLFIREILKLRQYIGVDRFVTILSLLYLISIPIVHMLELYSLRALLSVSMLFTLFTITLYALYHKNREAKYLVAGWALFWTASLQMYLSNIGIDTISNKIPFYTELTLVIEALIFAFSLAMMIRQIHRDKLTAQDRYIQLQASKEQLLTLKVEERTKELHISLQEKNILLKELNHRVKNSIQILVSFLGLEIGKIEDKKIQKTLIKTQNRILSINHLYALLNTKENISHVDAHAYISLLVANIQQSFYTENIDIVINTMTKLPSQITAYCGFILNEALTNALQHAFVDKNSGYIEIFIDKQDGYFYMSIKDNGVGFDSTKEFDSLGLTLLHALATKQLKGELDIISTDGTEVAIKWRDRDE